MISFFRGCLCLYVGLSLGFSGICNILSTSSLMSSTFTWCMWLWWYCCWCGWPFFCVWLVVFCVEFYVYLFGVCRGWTWFLLSGSTFCSVEKTAPSWGPPVQLLWVFCCWGWLLCLWCLILEYVGIWLFIRLAPWGILDQLTWPIETNWFSVIRKWAHSRYIHKLRWSMQDVKSVRSLLSCFSFT